MPMLPTNYALLLLWLTLHRFDSLISAILLLFAVILFIDGKQYGDEQYDGERFSLDFVSYACLSFYQVLTSELAL
jgi:hypothetical protein